MLIQLNLSQLILSSSVLVIFLGIIQWLIAKWLAIRLEKSVQLEYDKKLEDYRFQQLQRQKAETIARLFSKWVKYRGNESTYLNRSELIDFYEDINRMSLEISLWIKDEKILSDIMACFQLKPGAKNIRTLTGQIRKLILNCEDHFNPLEIVLWPSKEVEKNLFTKIPGDTKTENSQ